VFGEEFEAFGAGRGFGDDGNIFGFAEELVQAIAEDLVIVGEEYTNRRFGGLSHG
jgi:hypothetical protein